MRRISSGPLFLFIFLAASLASTPTLHAQPQPYYTLCRYQGQQDAHPIIYVTPIIHTSAGASDINQDFNEYMTAAYDLSKVQYGRGYCQPVSASAAQQAFTMSQLESQWAASKTVVTHIDWTDTPDEVAATNAKAAPQTSSAHAPTFFISCSTGGGAGIDIYYTSVFEIGAKPGPQPRTPVTLAVSPDGGKTWMWPAVLSQTVLDHFQAYLTQKGYNFKPGSASGCDVKPTEAAAKAAQHKRAYEGGGCSSCGKVVETGWKDQ